MTPLDRYLKCVARYVPPDQCNDILCELRANLLAEFEEHQIAPSEQAAFLKRYGSPLVIAARYRNDERRLVIGRELIGPALFPVFLHMLQRNVALSSVICINVGIILSLGIYGTIRVVLLQAVIQSVILILVFAAANHEMITKSPGKREFEDLYCQ